MHCLKIRALSWGTHIFKAIESEQSFSTSMKPDQQGSERKLCLPNHIPVHNADWFKCHFRQLYFKSDWLEIHFFSTLPFPFYAFVFTSAENMSLLPGLHMHDLPTVLIFSPFCYAFERMSTSKMTQNKGLEKSYIFMYK